MGTWFGLRKMIQQRRNPGEAVAVRETHGLCQTPGFLTFGTKRWRKMCVLATENASTAGVTHKTRATNPVCSTGRGGREEAPSLLMHPRGKGTREWTISPCVGNPRNGNSGETALEKTASERLRSPQEAAHPRGPLLPTLPKPPRVRGPGGPGAVPTQRGFCRVQPQPVTAAGFLPEISSDKAPDFFYV